MIQSIVFPKSDYTLREATNWLQSHGHKFHKVDETPNTYRFRQHEPIPHSEYYTKVLPNKVELVVRK